MDRYLIESPHELKDCARMLQQLPAMGYLHHFDWGCEVAPVFGGLVQCLLFRSCIRPPLTGRKQDERIRYS